MSKLEKIISKLGKNSSNICDFSSTVKLSQQWQKLNFSDFTLKTKQWQKLNF